QKLALCEAAYREAGLPMVVRITRFTQPAGLDGQLATLGLTTLDDTRVLVLPQLLPSAELPVLPTGLDWVPLGAQAYAETVGLLRGSAPEQRTAHAQRLLLSPVPYRGFALQRDGVVLACGQFAREAELVGLYDVFTADSARGQGLATLLCRRLLVLAASEGAAVAYLQVEHDNLPARRIYERRLGFRDGYRYHYRQLPAVD
ncbi:MAG: GNAT family N-acetyltransferase, partial [Rubrivivax sp.]